MIEAKDEAKDFYKLNQSRKSIRKFKPEEPPREMLERIIQAGFHAPSGKNRQNWKFFVVTGAKRKQYLEFSQKSWLSIAPLLKNKLKPSLYSFTERFFYTLGDAPVLLFAYAIHSQDEQPLTSVGSVYMAVQNINLAALAEGLGTCTMGAPLEIKSEVDAFLGVARFPEYQEGRMELLCGVVIGYPDHEPPKAPRQTEGRVVWL